MENIISFSIKDLALKLDDELWTYQTTYKTPIWKTSFKLIYRNHAIFAQD